MLELERPTEPKSLPPKKALKADVLGLVGAATLGFAMLSPAMTIYGLFGPTVLAAGRAAPLALIWALVATLPTAVSYALLSRDFPLSGSAASWIRLAAPKGFAIWAGWMVFLYYFTNFIIQPITLGLFAGDLFKPLGLAPGLTSYTVGALLCCIWPASLVYRGISLSTRGALCFLVIETAVVLGLCATVIWAAFHSGTPPSLEGFTLAGAPGGSLGIFRAMAFAMLAYCGFDVVSTLAEETKMARRLIPQATLLSLLLYAGMIIWGFWTLSYGADLEHLKKISEAGQIPISDVAERHWGGGAIWVSLTAVSATLGLTIAIAVGASRILFSMGREATAPSWLANLHVKYRAPWNALHLIFGVGLFAGLVSGAVLGPYAAFVWWGTTTSFFALLTYLLVHLANLLLNGRRALNSPLNFLGFAIVPILGLGIDGYILIRTFFIELWNQDFATGKSVILFDVACTIVAGYFAFRRSGAVTATEAYLRSSGLPSSRNL
jgi:putrescine importer